VFRLRMSLGWVALGVSALGSGSAAIAGDRPESKSRAPVDYAAQVKPILSRHCVSCHGAAKPRGGLRLDTATAALKGGKDGPAILPGHGEESPLVLSVRGEGDTERMPLNRPPLKDAEIALLQTWIDQGAQGVPG